MKRTVLLALGLVILVHGGGEAQTPFNLDDLVQRGDMYLNPQTFAPYSGAVERHWDNLGIESQRGILRERGTLVDGHWDGVHEWYHVTGELATKETYRNGVLNGPSETWFKTGRISARENYVNGQLDGPYESYWHRGRLAERGEFSAGEPCGNWLSFGRTVIYPACPAH